MCSLFNIQNMLYYREELLYCYPLEGNLSFSRSALKPAEFDIPILYVVTDKMMDAALPLFQRSVGR